MLRPPEYEQRPVAEMGCRPVALDGTGSAPQSVAKEAPAPLLLSGTTRIILPGLPMPKLMKLSWILHLGSWVESRDPPSLRNEPNEQRVARVNFVE